MGTFTYIARKSTGERVTGTLSVASARAVLSELAARDLMPVEVSEEKAKIGFGRRVSSRRLAMLYRQLADLLRAGVPLLRALKLLGRNKSNKVLAQVMTELAEAVSEGERLADAMAARPEVFPHVHVAMVRAGEQGGFMEQVLARLGTFLEHQADMNSKVIGNLIYPVVLLSLALAVVVAALTLFIPRFESMFARLELPLPTRILMGASNMLTQHYIITLVLTAGVVWSIMWLWKNPKVRRKAAEIQLKIPHLGSLASSLAVARFTRILGTMLDNGIPMLAAMQISRDAAGHPVLADAIDEAVEAVRSGETLAEPLERCGMLATDVVEMISVGESANNLPEVLITIAETLESRIDRLLNTLLRLMEPMLLLMLAGVVVFIFVALFMPMLQMSSSLGG